MVSGLYAGLLALLLVWLSFNVIKHRRAKKVRLGDGNDPNLIAAIRAQGNAAEYIPITLVLLVLLELAKAPSLILHVAGILMLAGRVMHAKGLLTDNLQYRVWGMQCTFLVIISLAVADVLYAIYL
jgi:uncharacterized protein